MASDVEEGMLGMLATSDRSDAFTALLLAASLALVSLGCKRAPKACSAKSLAEFTPSEGAVLSRSIVVGPTWSERDVWKGSVTCAGDRDSFCEARANMEARQHMPPGGGVELTPGQVGEPEKWASASAQPVPSPSTNLELSLGEFASAGQCQNALDALVRRGAASGGGCRSTTVGGRQRWTGQYRGPATSADFAPSGLPGLAPPQEFDSLKDCLQAKLMIVRTVDAANCHRKGAWTYDIRVFARDVVAAGPRMKIVWSPPAATSWDQAIARFIVDARLVGIVTLPMPDPSTGAVVIGCP